MSPSQSLTGVPSLSTDQAAQATVVIAGGAVGGVIGLASLVALGYFLVQRDRRSRAEMTIVGGSGIETNSNTFAPSKQPTNSKRNKYFAPNQFQSANASVSDANSGNNRGGVVTNFNGMATMNPNF